MKHSSISFGLYQTLGRVAYYLWFKCLSRIAGAVIISGLVAGAYGQPPSPTFTLTSGTYDLQRRVQITCSDPSAEIHYSDNGIDPTQNDRLIVSGSSVLIGRNLTLKARAWDIDGNTSSVTTATYALTGKLACGSQHVIALQANGRLFAWGQQGSGRLGNGLSASASVQMPVRVLKSAGVTFDNGADISAGNDHSLVVDSDWNPWAFGNNANGQLGTNSTTDSSYPVRVLKSSTAGDYLTGILQVSAGTAFSLATGTNGLLWAWGTTANGRLGNGATSGNQLVAVNVTTSDAGNPKLSGVVQATAGATFGLAIDGSGQVWSWGCNTNGQLGIGNTTQQTRATRVKLNSTTYLTGVKSISAGVAHCVALMNDGTVWCWGLQSNGRLGNGETASGNITYPIKVSDLSNIVKVVAGPDFNIALAANGIPYGWGNNVGNLGDQTTTDRPWPICIFTLPTAGSVVGIEAGGATGYGYSFGILSDGSLRSWGYNGQGELAINSTVTQTSAVAAAAGLDLNNQPPVLSLSTGGPYTAPATATLSATANDSDGTISRVEFYLGDSFLWSGNAAPYTFQLNGLTAGNYQVRGVAYDNNGASSPVVSGTIAVTDPISALGSTRYSRGQGTDPTYLSYVVAVDFEKGIPLDPLGYNFAKFPSACNDVKKLPWFLRTKKQTLFHAVSNGGVIAYTFPFENNLAAFGAEGGGSPLYTGQSYTFGVGSGGQDPYMTWLGDFAVAAYDKSTLSSGQTGVSGVFFQNIHLPRIETPEWEIFAQNGYVQTLDLSGTIVNGKPLAFKVTVQYVPSQFQSDRWGQEMSSPLLVTVTSNTTDFYFKIAYCGVVKDALKVEHWMALGDQNDPASDAYSVDFTLDFQQHPPWRSVYIDQPHFQGAPMPSAYQGKSTEELLHNAPPVKDTLTGWEPQFGSIIFDVDNSPELRRHPILDQFITDMNSDPLAMVNYVLNEIELTDAISYNDNGSIADTSINPGGVNRGALATFMEGQGSPAEQCALTVYLLRRAFIQCCYVFPQDNGTLMLDTQLSKLLRMQIRGAQDQNGNTNVPHLVPVNYPWVAAIINNKIVHIFPWLKDTAIEEGLDLNKYLPNGYNTGRQWLWHYLMDDPEIRGLSSEYDNPGVLFPLYIKKQLKINHPEVSIDQLGVTIYNRKNNFTSWGDLPHPWQTPLVSSSNLVLNLSAVPNIFDTIKVQVFSDRNNDGILNSGEPSLTTGTMRSLDLHNRRFLLYCEKTGANTHKMKLSLEEFRPGTSGTGTFSASADLLSPQFLSTNLSGTDDGLLFNVTYERHRSLSRSLYSNLARGQSFLGIGDVVELNDKRPLRKGDMAAFVLNYGRVTAGMMNEQAKKFWSAQQISLSNTTSAVSIEVTAGLPAYLMGMSYFYNVSQSLQQNLALTKTNVISFFAHGFSKIGAQRLTSGDLPNSGEINLINPKVDMSFQRTAWAGNGTLHADSGQEVFPAIDNWFPIFNGEASAQEHRTINKFFQQTDAVSTVKLLDLAQNGISGSNVIVIDKSNYLPGYPNSPWNTMINGLSLMQWAGFNPNYPNNNCLFKIIWDQFGNSDYNWDADYKQVLITKGPMTGASGCYQGMGAFIIGLDSESALISDNMVLSNGGWGSLLPDVNTLAPQPLIFRKSCITQNSDGSFQLLGANSTSTAPSTVSVLNFSSYYDKIVNGQFSLSPVQSAALNSESSWLGIPYLQGNSTSTANTIQAVANIGSVNPTSDNRSSGSIIDGLSKFFSDPVNSVTGEFYVDATDLRLNGPMPLEIRRSYGSLNIADGNFGYGWKLAYVPYLSISQDQNLIYAEEMDGSVVAYRRQSSPSTRWIPTPADNPQLANAAGDSIGSMANLFNNRIDLTTTSGTNYILTGVDGSTRTFFVQSFPISGSNGITRTRPYLQKWQDSSGNYYSFTFGQDSTAPEYGQLISVASSNGNYVVFKYDIFAHITEAFTGDGRRLYYKYDDNGDLIRVTLPDSSSIGYVYSHKSNTSGIGSPFYSEHLIIEEDKPGGRILTNQYDANRRVTQQSATVAQDFSLVTNATVNYVNSTGADGTISGYTLITDVNQHQTRYDYVNSHITKITDPLNQNILQTWFQQGDGLPGSYPRSLKSRIDKRGLLTEFQYDSKGNLVQKKETGNLSGAGSGEVAVSSYAYNALNMVTSGTDPLGNVTNYIYNNSSYPFLPTSIEKRAPGGTVSTTQYLYQTVGLSAGLLQTITKAVGTADQSVTNFTNNASGFVTSISQTPGTGDPTVKVNYFYNLRGELVSQTDAAIRTTNYAYDGRGNRIWQERRDESGSLVSWQYDYYNQNGEIEWTDGPRFDPEDYILRQYDAAGRLSQEIKWRSEAIPGGGGVEAVSGIDNAYATTFYKHDTFGNLTEVIDPRRNSTTMQYDAIGQMFGRQRHNGDSNSQVLSSESFLYEPGGQVSQITNPLLGVTNKYYTSRGQLRRQENPDGTVQQWNYDYTGRPTLEIYSNNGYRVTNYNDFTRTVTSSLYNSGGSQLAQETQIYDRRGNVVSKTDAENNTFSTIYDALDRVKTITGPAAAGNSAQQTTTHIYDAAGEVTTTVDGIGNMSVTSSDVEGRPVLVQVKNSDGTVVNQTSRYYTPDHQQTISTVGTGTNAVVTKSWTDNAGQLVLIVNADGSYRQSVFDSNENLLSSRDEVGNTTGYTYDALNRLSTEIKPSVNGSFAAQTTFLYDAMGNTTDRLMPGGNLLKSTFDSAGRKLSEELRNGSSVTRQFSFGYYGIGNPFVGKLQSVTDSRGVVQTTLYDDFLRPQTMNSSGPVAEQNQITTYGYDRRGLLKEVDQGYVTLSTGSTAMIRNYDGYGQISGETVNLSGTTVSQWSQSWNAGAQRAGLNWLLSAQGMGAGNAYGYAYRGDGLLRKLTNAGATYRYSYADNGLLLSRTNSWRLENIGRDSRGRVVTRSETVGSLVPLLETAMRNNDSRLNGYVANRIGTGVWNETRNYHYYPEGHLLDEQYMPVVSGTWKSLYYYDNSQTQSQGPLLGVRSALDLQALPNTTDAQPGSYELTTADVYQRPLQEGLALQVNNYSPVGANYDGVGNVISRTLADGSTQTLVWDALGRLVKVTQSSGLVWNAVYDGLGRRIQTGAVSGGQVTTISSFYDPQVEFLELGVSVNGMRTWKVQGPDLNGHYGSLQGTGGIEATVDETTGTVTPVINDAFGNVVASINGTTTVWKTAQVSSFGVVSGTVPLLSGSVSLAQATLWRSHRIDPTGYYYMGARYYEPQSGRFLSPDPLSHTASMSLYDYASGDPVNGLDPDGRFGKGVGTGVGNGASSLMLGVTSGVTTAYWAATNPLLALDSAKNEWSDISNSASGFALALSTDSRGMAKAWNDGVDAGINNLFTQLSTAKGAGEFVGGVAFNTAAIEVGGAIFGRTGAGLRGGSGIFSTIGDGTLDAADTAGMATGASDLASISARTQLMRQKLVQQMGSDLGYDPAKVLYQHIQDGFRGGSVDSMGNIVIDGNAFDANFLAKYGISGPREIMAHEIGHMEAGIANESGASLMGSRNPGLTRNQSLNLFGDYLKRNGIGGN